jgi:hypothetical protein
MYSASCLATTSSIYTPYGYCLFRDTYLFHSVPIPRSRPRLSGAHSVLPIPWLMELERWIQLLWQGAE